MAIDVTTFRALYESKFRFFSGFTTQYPGDAGKERFFQTLADGFAFGGEAEALLDAIPSGQQITVQYSQGEIASNPASATSVGRLRVDLDAPAYGTGPEATYYFNGTGNLFKSTLTLDLWHEITHAVRSGAAGQDGIWHFYDLGQWPQVFGDPNTNIVSLRGSVVDTQNLISSEYGGPGQQLSYQGWLLLGDGLDVNRSYTFNQPIDTALVDHTDGKTGNPVANSDINLTNLGSSRDLVLALAGNDTVRGGDGGDWLYGNDGADKLYGDAGNDHLYGGTEIDELDGGSENDTLAGGAGADTLTGGGGNDVLNGYDDKVSADVDRMDGGLGGDIYYMSATDVAFDTGNDGSSNWDYFYRTWGSGTAGKVNGYYSNRWTWFESSIPTDAQRGIAPANELGFDAQDGISTTELIQLGLARMTMDENGRLVLTETGTGALAYNAKFNWVDDGGLHLDAGRESQSLHVSARNYELEGTSRADLMIGDDTDNEMKGKSGKDELSGEGGNDSLDGGSGDDDVYGDRGDDHVDGGSGNDRLWGGSDNDYIEGGSGADMLSGNDGNDTLDGVSGDDRILSGAGTDRLTGSSGNDVFVFHARDGADVITDYRWFGRGNHHDNIEISADIAGFDSFADIQAAATQVGSSTVIDFGNGDTLTLENVRMSSLQANDFAFM